MTRPGRYPQELRERAVRMVFEHQDEHPWQWAASCSIAHKFGVSSKTLRKWVRQAETDTGSRPGLTTDERERLKTLERENRKLRRANEILKSAAAFFGRSSTADRADDRRHPRQQGPLWGRADLPSPADRPIHLPCRQPTACLGSSRARRPAQGRDHPGAGRALRGLGCRQGLAAAAPRSDHGGRLHRGAAPARAGPGRCPPWQGLQDHHAGSGRSSAR
jgi:transposase